MTRYDFNWEVRWKRLPWTSCGNAKPLTGLVGTSPVSGKVLHVGEGPSMALGGSLPLSAASPFSSESRNNSGSTHLTGLLRQNPLGKGSNHFTPAPTKCPSQSRTSTTQRFSGSWRLRGGSEPIFQVSERRLVRVR